MRRHSRLGAYWVSISAVCACSGCWRTPRYLRWVTECLSECVSVLHLHHQQDVFIFYIYIKKKPFVPHAKVASDELHTKMFSALTPLPSSFISFPKESSWQERCRQKPRTRWKLKGFYVAVQICYLQHNSYKMCNISKRLNAHCVYKCNGTQAYNCL